jgi:hypothetical protein
MRLVDIVRKQRKLLKQELKNEKRKNNPAEDKQARKINDGEVGDMSSL